MKKKEIINETREKFEYDDSSLKADLDYFVVYRENIPFISLIMSCVSLIICLYFIYVYFVYGQYNSFFILTFSVVCFLVFVMLFKEVIQSVIVPPVVMRILSDKVMVYLTRGAYFIDELAVIIKYEDLKNIEADGKSRYLLENGYSKGSIHIVYADNKKVTITHVKNPSFAVNLINDHVRSLNDGGRKK